MQRIGIDARLFSQTGVGVYLRNLLYYLDRLATDNYEFYIYLLAEDYEKYKPKNKKFSKRLTHFKWHTFGEQAGFGLELYQDNLDLMHFTYFSYPISYRKKFIATIHDTTPLTFKTGKASTKNPWLYELKFQAFKLVISNQLKNAKYIITPTETVKKQLVQIYSDKYESKIMTIYEGVDYQLKKISNIKYQISNKIQITNFKNDKFFIYIGNFYPHKNVESLVSAFAKVKTDAQLILIGPDDFFSKRLLKLIETLHQEKRIIFFHNPAKKELVFFYKNALALIHPSLSEGFGLPIIESVYFNLPIIASEIAVFREILGDSYISFDPKNPEDITKTIILFLENKNKFNYGGILKKFSFADMSKKTFDLYHQALD